MKQQENLGFVASIPELSGGLTFGETREGSSDPERRHKTAVHGSCNDPFQGGDKVHQKDLTGTAP